MSMNYIIIIVRVVGSEEVDCRNFENTLSVQVIYCDNTKKLSFKTISSVGNNKLYNICGSHVECNFSDVSD